jgi:hypothetical protein
VGNLARVGFCLVLCASQHEYILTYHWLPCHR